MLRIPVDAKILDIEKLTLLAVLNELGGKHQTDLKTTVKATMTRKKAKFAQSKFAVASLQPGWVETAVNIKKAFGLVKAGKITLEQLQTCMTIQQKPLTQFLSELEIKKLLNKLGKREASLKPELKPGVSIDLLALEKVIEAEIERQLKDVTPGKLAA